MEDKTDNDNDVGYEKHVDEIDEHLVEAFNKLDLDKATADPLRCYLMLKLMLNKIGEFSPGMQIKDVRGQMKIYIGDAKIKKVEGLAEKIAAKLKKIVNPTYLAASYWSPIDDRRHTALYRRKEPADEKERKKVLAYTCAFFALTFFGAKQGYYSASQYTADQAKRKRGVRVSYVEGCDPEIWWCVSKNIHQQILDETGITTAIEKYFLKDDVSSESLKEGLRPLISNREADPDTNLKPFAEDYISSFPKIASEINKEPPDYVVQAMKYINNIFEAELDEEKSLFMLLTNVIYDVAFESNYFYAFPVRIPDLCSILTVGTEEPLDSKQYLAIDRVATSIFMQPLLLDYASRVANTERESFQLNAAETIAHEFKNLTRDIPGLGSRLLNQYIDAGKTARHSYGEESPIYKKISLLEKDSRILSTISKFTGAISFATYSLTDTELLKQIKFIDDPECEIFKAVTYFALDMCRATKPNWKIEEYNLEESLSIIERVYQENDVSKLARRIDFALLLLILNEPIRNMRNRDDFDKEVKIRIEVRARYLILCQETIEYEASPDSIPSDSVKRINKLLNGAEGLSEKFVHINENVCTVNCVSQGNGLFKVSRETQIEVFKIPILQSQ